MSEQGPFDPLSAFRLSEQLLPRQPVNDDNNNMNTHPAAQPSNACRRFTTGRGLLFDDSPSRCAIVFIPKQRPCRPAPLVRSGVVVSAAQARPRCW